jgi:hypothetical protein
MIYSDVLMTINEKRVMCPAAGRDEVMVPAMSGSNVP